MKPRRINDEYDLIVPDHVADWDAPSEWERARMTHTIEKLGPADLLLDVGVEHGWISGLYAKYIGCEMILAEPSAPFWPNIRRVWEHNELKPPVLCVQAYIGETASKKPWWSEGWPNSSQGPECGAMAYSSLAHPGPYISTVRIDDLPLIPTAITMDVEGAELLALRGGEATLLRDRPLVWVSIHPDLMMRDYDTKPIEVLDFMGDLGYGSTLLAVDHEEHWFFEP